MSSTQIETRERILIETWHLMEKRQGQGVRLEDIARAAGVSRQAIYLHFGSRSGLMIATARYLDEVLGLAERLKPILEAQGSLPMIKAYVEFWANYIPDIYGLAKALMNARATDEAAAVAWKDRMDAVYEGCIQVVTCLQKEGVLAPQWTLETASDFFWSMVSLETWEKLTIDRGWTKEQYIEQIQRALLGALVYDPPNPDRR